MALKGLLHRVTCGTTVFGLDWRLGGGQNKMVEIEVKGQMITHDFLAPDRMSSSSPKTLVAI